MGIAVALYSIAWVSPSTRTIGSGGDGPDFVWFLAWMAFALEHHLNPLFTTYMNAPRGVNLAWQTPAPLITLLASPLTVWLGPLVAYNAVVTIGVAISASAVTVVSRRWVQRAWTAMLAGVLFLIAPYVDGQALEHPFLVLIPFVPLTLWWMDAALARRWKSAARAGLVLGGLILGEFYCSEEAATDLVLLLALGLALLWLTSCRRFNPDVWRILRSSGVALLVSGIGVAPYALWQFFGPERIAGAIMPPDLFVARLSALVIPGPASLLSVPSLQKFAEGGSFNLVEFGTYLGIPSLFLLGYLVWFRWGDARIRTLTCLLVAVVVLSLGSTLHVTGASTGIPLPGWLLFHLPILDGVVPVRLAGFADILAALLLAMAVDSIASSRLSFSNGMAAVAALVVVVTWLPTLPYPALSLRTPAYLTHGVSVRAQTLLIVPFAQNLTTAEPMQWQAVADFRFRMVDGYFTRTSGVWPSGQARAFYHGPRLNYLTWDIWALEHAGYAPLGLNRGELGFEPIAIWRGSLRKPIGKVRVVVDEQLREFVTQYLAAHRVAAVVVGPTGGRLGVVRFFDDVFGFGPKRTDGVVEWEKPFGGWRTARALGREELE